MAAPNYNFQLVAAAVAGAVAQGTCAVESASGYVTSTLGARGAKRSSGIAVGPAPAGGNRLFVLQTSGDIPAALSGLEEGAAGPVRVNDAGALERRPTPQEGDDIVGWAEASGLVHAAFGVLPWDHFSGGASSVPTGTGFRHVTGGVEDATAKLVVDADVSALAAIALSKLAAPTGSGFVTVTAGAFDAAALATVANAHVSATAAIAVSKLAPGSNGQYHQTVGGVSVWAALSVALASQVTGTLPIANGGTGLTAPPGGSGSVLFNNGNTSYGGITNVTTDGVNQLQLLSTSCSIQWLPAGATSGLIRIKSGALREIVNTDDGGGGNRSLLWVNTATAEVSIGHLAYYLIHDGANQYIRTGGTNRITITGSTDIKLALPVAGDASQSLPFRWKRAAITQSSTSDTTLTASQAECVVLDVTGTPGGAFNVIAPNTADAFYIASNGTPSTMTLKKSGGAGFAIATVKTAQARHNGSDYVRVTPDA